MPDVLYAQHASFIVEVCRNGHCFCQRFLGRTEILHRHYNITIQDLFHPSAIGQIILASETILKQANFELAGLKICQLPTLERRNLLLTEKIRVTRELIIIEFIYKLF